MVTMNTESAYMTSKGQVVIPARLRRKYGLKEGTRLNFVEEEGRFVLDGGAQARTRIGEGVPDAPQPAPALEGGRRCRRVLRGRCGQAHGVEDTG